jgi:hypothetical protein
MTFVHESYQKPKRFALAACFSVLKLDEAFTRDPAETLLMA